MPQLHDADQITTVETSVLSVSGLRTFHNYSFCNRKEIAACVKKRTNKGVRRFLSRDKKQFCVSSQDHLLQFFCREALVHQYQNLVSINIIYS